jgi:hypothetical protein
MASLFVQLCQTVMPVLHKQDRPVTALMTSLHNKVNLILYSSLILVVTCFKEIQSIAEFGERFQENGFSPVQVFSNSDADPSKQGTLPLPHYSLEQAMHEGEY